MICGAGAAGAFTVSVAACVATAAVAVATGAVSVAAGSGAVTGALTCRTAVREARRRRTGLRVAASDPIGNGAEDLGPALMVPVRSAVPVGLYSTS